MTNVKAIQLGRLVAELNHCKIELEEVKKTCDRQTTYLNKVLQQVEQLIKYEELTNQRALS